MDCVADCTYTTDAVDTTYDVGQDTFGTDVVVEFPALDAGTAVALPAESPQDWGLTTAPAAPAPAIPSPAPSIDSVTNDMFVQSMANDMFIDVLNSQSTAMSNLTSPYSAGLHGHVRLEHQLDRLVKDGDLTPSTPTTSSYDD